MYVRVETLLSDAAETHVFGSLELSKKGHRLTSTP